MQLPIRSLLAAGACAGMLTSTSMAQSVTPTPPIPVGNVFFDYFLFDNAGQPANGFGSPALPLQQFLLWTVTDGTTDLVGGNAPGIDDLADGGRYVDLGGSTNDPGRMQTRQSFPFSSAITYELFFEYRSTDGLPASADVEVAGKRFTVNTSSTAFQNFSTTFTVDAPLTTPLLSTLAFQDLGNDNSGIGIDAVLLNIVPEPASLGLLAGGAFLLSARRSRG